MVTQYVADLESSAERMQVLISEFKACVRTHDASLCRKLITRMEGELNHVARISHEAELINRHNVTRPSADKPTVTDSPRMLRGRTGV